MGSWNFAHRPFRDHRPLYAVSAILFLAGAVLLVANVRLFTSDRRSVADVRAEIAALEARQNGADSRARDARSALSSYRLSALADESRELARVVAERRFSWTGLLARLERTLPSDVGIQRLQPQFDKDGHVALDLQLVGRSREAVVPTIAALTTDPAFSAVGLRNESQPEGTTADPFQFQIVSRYDADAKSEDATAAETPAKKPKRPAEKKPARPAPAKPVRPAAPRPGLRTPGKATP
jgi:hypothetical protein